MKKYFLLFQAAVLLIPAIAFSQPEADAVFKKISKQYVLNQDGSMEFRCIKEVRLLTYLSFHRLYGETFIVYNPQFQNLKVNESYTIMADGKKVVTPPNAFNEVLPGTAANAPAYNHLREMVVTHTGLERKATIFLDYTITSKPGYLPELMGNEFLTEYSPVEEYDIKVSIPADKPFNYKLLNITGEPVESHITGQRSWTWSFRNIHAFFHEPVQPRDEDFEPRLIFSTFGDLAKASGWFTNQPAFRFGSDDQMKKAVEKVRNESSDPLTIALKLQDIVVNQLNYNQISLYNAGFRVRPAEEVWNSNYGTEAEKAVLLTALLSEANINAEPVAAVPGYFDQGMGNLLNFSEILVKVELGKNNFMYLSPVRIHDQDPGLSLAGKTVLSLNPRKPAVIYLEKPVPASAECEAEFRFSSPDKMEGSAMVTFTGALNPFLELKKAAYGPGAEKKAVEYLTEGLSAGDFSAVKLRASDRGKTILSYEVRKEDPLEKYGDYFILTFPQLSRGIKGADYSDLTEERHNPAEIPYPVTEKYTCLFNLPQGIELVTPDVHIEKQNQTGKILISLSKTGDQVRFDRILSLNAAKGDTSLYKDIRELIGLWNTGKYKELVFKKKP